MKVKTNINQIIRFDGKNVFFEVMANALPIGKIQINFIEYDATQEKNNRIKQNITIYIDQYDALVLANDILSGKMKALADKAKEEAKAKGLKYAPPIFIDIGGVSAKVLEKRNEKRADGMSLSRQFKITPGEKMPWILSAETGPGEENENGLIVPKYNPAKPEQIVRVPLDDNNFKKFALVIKTMVEYNIKKQLDVALSNVTLKKTS